MVELWSDGGSGKSITLLVKDGPKGVGCHVMLMKECRLT